MIWHLSDASCSGVKETMGGERGGAGGVRSPLGLLRAEVDAPGGVPLAAAASASRESSGQLWVDRARRAGRRTLTLLLSCRLCCPELALLVVTLEGEDDLEQGAQLWRSVFGEALPA